MLSSGVSMSTSDQEARRQLPDGCEGCGKSVNYCASVRDLERRACCPTCAHPEPS